MKVSEVVQLTWRVVQAAEELERQGYVPEAMEIRKVARELKAHARKKALAEAGARVEALLRESKDMGQMSFDFEDSEGHAVDKIKA